MSRTVVRTGTLTVNFSSLDSDHAYRSITTPENAFKGTGNSSTYCGVNPTRGNNAETWYYFKFDTSSLPANAVIDSVSCSVRNWATSGFVTNNRFTQAYMTMSSGTTEKGTSINILQNYSNNVRTFAAGTWTRAELNDVRVKFYAKRGTTNSNTDYQMRVYGGTLTIQYSYEEEVQGQDIFFKQNGSWVPVDSVFYKQNGSWVQVEEMLVKDSGTWNN